MSLAGRGFRCACNDEVTLAGQQSLAPMIPVSSPILPEQIRSLVVDRQPELCRI